MRQLLLSICFLSLTYWSLGQSSAPKYSNEFMNLGAGARAFGMGLSSVAYVNDATSPYWNPAGMNNMETDHQLMLMHSNYFGGIASYDFAAFVTSVDTLGHFGLSLLRFSVDDIADTRYLIDGSGGINYDNIRYFSAADYAVLLSYARPLNLPFVGDFDFGANVKIIRRVVGDFATSWGFGIDLGAAKTWKGWQFGVMGKDLFGTFNSWSYNVEELSEIYTQTGNELPVNGLEVSLPRLILGVSRTFDIGERFSIMNTLDLNATFDGKRNTPVRTELVSLDPAFGVEGGFKEMVFLRAGVNQFQQIKDFNENESWSFQPSMGVGLKLRELTIDYAFTDIGDQAAGLYSHVFSVKVDFYNAKD